MALMVFLAFMSIFMLYWVPVMMEDNEENHMRAAIGQFSKLKETVDEQISLNIRNETRDTTIELGADGVPMFERETASQLSLRLSSEFFNYTFEDSGRDIFENSSGSIDMITFNRYYVRQTLIYENGAVLIYQKKGEIVKDEPEFNVEKEGDELILSATLVSLYQVSDDSITGTAPEHVSTQLWYTDRWTYNNITSTNKRVSLMITTRYTTAWVTYYDATLQNSGLIDGADYNITTTSNTIQITFERVSEFTLSHAFIEARIGREA